MSAMSKPGPPIVTCTPPPKQHSVLKIEEITFNGNHTVDKDTFGNFGSPEWVEGRSQDDQSPICYTRNKAVQLTARFKVTTQPSQSETVAVKGKATFGSAAIEWNGSVTVTPSDNEVTTPFMPSNKLPDSVGYYNTVGITWEINPDNTGWSGAGTSNHVIYVTLGDPTSTPAYWTLLEVSCKEAHGETMKHKVVAAIFEAFRRSTGAGNGIKRMRDGKELRYWARGYQTDNKPLLQGKPEGRCGNWSNFLLAMYKVHGITDGVTVIMHRTKQDYNLTKIGFLVKNWDFSSPGTLSVPFTHKIMTECKMKQGIKAQGMDNTQPFFFDHVIVKYKDEFYDPSYGVGPFSNMMEYEKGAIAGLGGIGLKGGITDFAGNLIYVPKSYCSEGFVEYTVKPNDSLSKIAQRYGIASWNKLYDHIYNKNFRALRTKPNYIEIGDLIYIPFDIAKKINILKYFYTSSGTEIESKYRWH